MAALDGGFSLNMGDLFGWEDLKGIHRLGTRNKKALKIPWIFSSSVTTLHSEHPCSSSLASVTLSILHLSKTDMEKVHKYLQTVFFG